jgi:type I restriction enzyme S subunit
MIADMPIVLPSIQEQKAISFVLSDMENELDTLNQRLTKTKQIKQGMMQELLTGKTRLI